jgi:2-polyprenyl-3-methyl-5-hydroxy-6-metoxy-1,4-benzoquinol methylase
MVPYAGLLLASTLAVSGCSTFSKVDWSRAFSRDAFSQPERVLEALAVAEGSRVADLGAGKGYFTVPLARAVGPRGRVYAVEVDAASLRALRRRAQADGLAQVEVVEATHDDPRLPDGQIDLVLLSSVFHHLDDRSAYFARLRSDLAPGARVAVIEPRASWASWLLLLPPGHGVAPARMRAEMADAGYRPVASHDFLPAHSFEVFAPVPEP